jgi:hypothetical protein
MTNHPGDELLHDFVDGRLDDSERDAVALHLLDCPRCQTIVAATEELIDSGRASRQEGAAPADLWPLVAATTIHERAVKRHVLRSVRRELAVAAAVLILLSGAAGAFGMRIAMRAGDGFGDDRRVNTRVERVTPQIAVGLEGLRELENLRKLENIRVEARGHGIGGSHPADAPEPPEPPEPPAPGAVETARAVAAEYIGQMLDREARALDMLRRQDITRARFAEIEDSLFQTNRRLAQLRAVYMNVPDNASIASELESLFDSRIALIRAASAEAEKRSEARARTP